MRSLDNLKVAINDKFNNINDQLATIKSSFKGNLDNLVAESLSENKDSIIVAFCEKKFKTSSKDWKIEESNFSVATWSGQVESV